MAETRDRSETKSVLETIFTERGRKEIFDAYKEALENSVPAPPNYQSIEDFRKIYDYLMEHPCESSDRFEYPSIEEAHKKYLHEVKNNMERWGICRLYQKSLQNGYPCVSFRTTRNESTKLQLHQVPHFLEHSTNGVINSDSYIGKGYVASHLCHNKSCIVCPIKAPAKANKARDFCRPLCIVYNRISWVCMCTPPCKDISPHAYE